MTSTCMQLIKQLTSVLVHSDTQTEPQADASWAHEEVLVCTLSMLLYHNKVGPIGLLS